MNALQIFTLILFGLTFISVGTTVFSIEFLFTSIERKYPKYYNQIGRPTMARMISLATPPDIPRRFNGSNYALKLIFKGLPSHFPKDDKLQKLANFNRQVSITSIILWVTTAIPFIYFASRNMTP